MPLSSMLRVCDPAGSHASWTTPPGLLARIVWTEWAQYFAEDHVQALQQQGNSTHHIEKKTLPIEPYGSSRKHAQLTHLVRSQLQAF